MRESCDQAGHVLAILAIAFWLPPPPNIPSSWSCIVVHFLAIFLAHTFTEQIYCFGLLFNASIKSSLILRRPRSFAAPSLLSLSRLMYSVRNRVHDVRAIVNFHQSERVYHIPRSVECMECKYPHIESNQNGGRCERFRFSCAKRLPSFWRGKTVPEQFEALETFVSGTDVLLNWVLLKVGPRPTLQFAAPRPGARGLPHGPRPGSPAACLTAHGPAARGPRPRGPGNIYNFFTSISRWRILNARDW